LLLKPFSGSYVALSSHSLSGVAPEKASDSTSVPVRVSKLGHLSSRYGARAFQCASSSSALLRIAITAREKSWFRWAVGRGVGGRVVGRTTDLAPLHEADITRGEQVLQSFITFRTLVSNTKKHRPWPVWKRPTGPCSARPRSVPPPPSKKNR